MNNHKSDQDNNKKEEPQISIEFDDDVIQLPLSTFNNIIEREVTNCILENQTNQTPKIDVNELVNLQYWKKKYKDLEDQVTMLSDIAECSKRDLKINKFAQPKRCMSRSISQLVYISQDTKRKMTGNALKISKNNHQTFTISDSEDDVVITTDTSNIKSIQTKNANIIDLDTNTQNLEVKFKPDPKSETICISDSEDDVAIITDTSDIKSIQTKNANTIDLTDLDDYTQNLEVKCKPASKSKTNVSIPDLKTNDNNKVLPINTEAGKTLGNGKCLSTTIRKRRPGPKSKTMLVSDRVCLKSKTNVSIPDLKTNDNNKVLPINTEAGKTLGNGKCLSTTIRKRRPGPKSKTMLVSNMVSYNDENEETVNKKMRLKKGGRDQNI